MCAGSHTVIAQNVGQGRKIVVLNRMPRDYTELPTRLCVMNSPYLLLGIP